MFRAFCSLALLVPCLAAQASCLSTRESKPQDWYAWANVLVAAEVSGLAQRGRYDVLTLRVAEIFKGPVGVETLTLEVPANLWEACKLARPAVGAHVLGALNANNDANVVPLGATYADELRALRPAPIALTREATPAVAAAEAKEEPIATRCVASPVYGASVKVESCEQSSGAVFLRGEVLRVARENFAPAVEGLAVPTAGQRYSFFKPSAQCTDYGKNAALTGRLSHPCCDAKQPYCTRKTDFLIDEGPGAASPLR